QNKNQTNRAPSGALFYLNGWATHRSIICYNTSMEHTQLQELKQFIQATVSQATSDAATKDDIAHLATKEAIKEIESDLAQIQSAIGDAVSSSNESIDGRLDNHEERISKLEHQAT